MEASARSVAATVFVLAAVLAYPAAPGAQAQLVSIVIVRHPETEPSRPAQPIIPLSSVGRQRAALLVHTLEDVKFTHMFASHTTRSREAIEGVAAKNALPVVQLPAPGSLLDGARHRPDNPSRGHRTDGCCLNPAPAGKHRLGWAEQRKYLCNLEQARSTCRDGRSVVRKRYSVCAVHQQFMFSAGRF
jgi:Histidine phosphatase superfamily (branch 1)